MHISLTGNLGSGKSTVCKLIINNMGYECYSTGTIIRKLAEERGLSVLEMNQLMQSDSKYDNMIDDAVSRFSKEEADKKIIFDSRLAWHFAERSFKIFMSVEINEAARRVFADNQRGEVEKYASVEDAKEHLIARANTEDDRYRKIYGLDYFNFSNYDLVIDSTYCKPELLAQVIEWELERYEKSVAENKAPETRILMSPKRLGASAVAEYIGTEDKYYLTTDIKIAKAGEEYIAEAGKEIIDQAAADGIAFLSVKLGDK